MRPKWIFGGIRMRNIVIIGAGGFGREVAWLIEEINTSCETWNLKGFLDGAREIGQNINGYPILGDENWLLENSNVEAVIAIGDPLIRKKIAHYLESHNISFATLIHPDVAVHFSVNIGLGTVICKGSILTVNVDIGDHVIINLDSTIGHDAVINNYVTIFPSVNVSGNVSIGSYSLIGTGTQIIQEVTIGENAYLGAGSVVNRAIPSNALAVGVPAKVIKSRDPL